MSRPAARRTHLAPAAAVVVAVVAVVAALSGCGGSSGSDASSRPAGATTSTSPSPASSGSPASGGSASSDPASGSPASADSAAGATAAASASAAARASATRAAAARASATATIAALTAHLGKGGVSVAATDLRTGARFAYGATAGMRCASISKLDIIETLMLRHQKSGEPLSDEQTDLATSMIEHSDNDAANALYSDLGEGAAVLRSAGPLGMRHLVPADGDYWGLNTSSAADYLALLRNVARPGVLDAHSRAFISRLMAHVESDQRWGVPTAADDGTTARVKNGWLPTSLDHERWMVNSVGIVTTHGDPLLVAVMTQHGASFDAGVALVGRIARITARAVTAT